MNSTPRPITVDRQGDCVTFRLPPRQTVAESPFNALNVTLLVIGFVLGLSGFSGLLNGLIGDAETIAARLWPLLPLVIGAGFLLVGLNTVIGRTEIRLDGRTFSITERVGPFYLTRRRRVEDVARLRLRLIDVSPQHHDYDKDPPKVIRLLRMDADDGRSTTITYGYPHEVLESAAREIAGHMSTDEPVAVVVEQIDGEIEGGVPADVQQSPPGCSPRISRDSGRFSMYLPAPGFRGPIGAVALTAGVLLLVALSFGAAVVVHTAKNPDPGDIWIAWVVIGAMSGFLLIVLGLTVNIASTQVIFDIEDDRLVMSRKSLVRTRQWTWPREKIREVRCHHPTHASNQPHRRSGGFELQIVSRIGRADGRLKGRRREELDWIAAVLNRELNGAGPTSDREDAAVDFAADSPTDPDRRADASP